MSPNNRKRPAPEGLAIQQSSIQPQQPLAPPQSIPQVSQQPVTTTAPSYPNIEDQLIRWNADSGLVMDPSGNPLIPSPLVPAGQEQYLPGAAGPSTSTALTRRAPGGRALMVPGRTGFESTPQQWPSIIPPGNHNALATITPAAQSSEMVEQQRLKKLSALAQEAKKEAMANKKQIPPFVQKLSSFLDDDTGKYHDLIRWSAKGDSFFVMNEDEFAKKLIPDLFKHNNYASFVRQLNMYGFHKRVGLSDNSMRASERKNKSPSEYYNDYFRRGHPDLLWLITKPKNNKSKSRQQVKNDSDGESADEARRDDTKHSMLGQGPRALPSSGDYPITRQEIEEIHAELNKFRENQAIINQNFQEQTQRNSELIRMTQRHDATLRAILGFLAIHFSKSIEESKGSSGGLSDLLATFIPPGQMNAQSHVYGDFVSGAQKPGSQMGGNKRVRHLLEAPPSQHGQNGISGLGGMSGFHPEMGSVTEILDHTPDVSAATPPLSSMVSDVDTSNFVNGFQTSGGIPAGSSLSSAPGHKSGSSVNPLRSTVESVRNSPVLNSATPILPMSTAQNIPSIPAMSNSLSTIPNMQTAGGPVSLSPILRSIGAPMPMPDPNPDDFLRMQKMIQDQNEAIENLSNRISPLSPSGRLPFDLNDPSSLNNYLGTENNDFDINEFLDSSAYQPNDVTFGSFDSLDPGVAQPDLNALGTSAPQTTTMATSAPLTANMNVLGMPPGPDLSELSMNSPIMSSSVPVPTGLPEDLLNDQLQQPDLKRRRVN